MRTLGLLSLLLLLFVVGCASNVARNAPDAGEVDADTSDAALVDAGVDARTDSGAVDSGAVDSGAVDSGAVDAPWFTTLGSWGLGFQSDGRRALIVGRAATAASSSVARPASAVRKAGSSSSPSKAP